MKLPSLLRDVQFSITEVESVVDRVDNLSNLRSNVFVLQKSFCTQGRYEVEKERYRNERIKQEEIQKLMNGHINYRKDQASNVEKQPLIVLLSNILECSSHSSRILGYLKLELVVARRSDSSLQVLILEVNQLNAAFAELSQSSNQNDQTVMDAHMRLVRAKLKYNTAVVSPEHF
jgi:hypothetical protein